MVGFIKIDKQQGDKINEKGELHDNSNPNESNTIKSSRAIRDVKIIAIIQMVFELALLIILSFELYGLHLFGVGIGNGNNLEEVTSSCQNLYTWIGVEQLIIAKQNVNNNYYYEWFSLITVAMGLVWAVHLYMLVNKQDYKKSVTTKAIGAMLGIYVCHLVTCLLILPLLCGSSNLVSFTNIVLNSAAIRIYVGLFALVILGRLLVVIRRDWIEPQPTSVTLSFLEGRTNSQGRRNEIPGIIAGLKVAILFMTSISVCTTVYVIGRRVYNAYTIKETSYEYFDNWLSRSFADNNGNETDGILVDNSWGKDVLIWLGSYALVCLFSIWLGLKMWKSYGDAKSYEELNGSGADAHKFIQILLCTLFFKFGLVIAAAKIRIYELKFVWSIEIAQALLAVILLIGIVLIKRKAAAGAVAN